MLKNIIIGNIPIIRAIKIIGNIIDLSSIVLYFSPESNEIERGGLSGISLKSNKLTSYSINQQPNGLFTRREPNMDVD